MSKTRAGEFGVHC